MLWMWLMLAVALLLAGAASGQEPARAASASWHGGSMDGGIPPGYYWPSRYNCRDRGCFKPTPNPEPVTAWQYISSSSKHSFLTKLISGTAYQAILDQPFEMTLLAPTDEAFDNYFTTFSPALITLLGNDAERKGNAWKMVMGNFFPKLLPYHVIPTPVYAKDLKAGTWYNTLYSTPNGLPHKVYFGSKDVPMPKGDTVSRYARPCRSCKQLKWYLMDEQNKVVTITEADKFVRGGGVVHVINGVLQPNDIFPNVLAALKFNNYTALITAVNIHLESAWGRNGWGFLETNAGTFVAPTNEAWDKYLSSFGGEWPSPDEVQTTLNYLTCPLVGSAITPSNLQYTPFSGTGPNPAVTTLGYKRSDPAISLFFKKGADQTFSVEARPTGQQATIVFPDITTPMNVIHGIDTVFVPPPL